MGSSSGTANPAYLSQGNQPIPGLPIAGQGAPNDNPRNFGSFQQFLPDIQAPGGTAGGNSIPSDAETRLAPSATGLKSEMFQYRSPQGAVAPGGGGAVTNSGVNSSGASASDVDSLRQQLATLQAQQQFGAARSRGLASGSPTDGPYPSDLWG